MTSKPTLKFIRGKCLPPVLSTHQQRKLFCVLEPLGPAEGLAHRWQMQ